MESQPGGIGTLSEPSKGRARLLWLDHRPLRALGLRRSVVVETLDHFLKIREFKPHRQ
jgi:hypothetical protein